MKSKLAAITQVEQYAPEVLGTPVEGVSVEEYTNQNTVKGNKYNLWKEIENKEKAPNKKAIYAVALLIVLVVGVILYRKNK